MNSLDKLRLSRKTEKQSEPKVICSKCGEQSGLRTLYCGSYTDVAWGRPKLIREYMQVTECCRDEDYEDLPEGE